MNRTYSLEETYDRMSCFSVMQVGYKERCDLSKLVQQCNYIMNFFKYYEFMYCTIEIQNKGSELFVISVFILIVIALMIMMAHLVEKYFVPALKILSVKLNMNEYLAGVTLLSFGNTSPDLMANLMPIRSHAPLFTITMSNALAIILISGGMVCYMRSFKINGSCAVRDLLFLLLACELLIYVSLTKGFTSKFEALCLITLYIVYLLISIFDLLLMRHTIKALRKEIDELYGHPEARDVTRRLKEKTKLLHELERDEILVIRQRVRKSHIRNTVVSSARSSFRRTSVAAFSTRRPEARTPKVDEARTRNSRYNESNSRNKSLWVEFFKSLLPIDSEEWRDASVYMRIFLIVTLPIVLPFCIFIPVVDYSQHKHGWSKLLNCIQIMSNPFVVISLSQAMLASDYQNWHLSMDFKYAIWSLFVTVPLAIIVFFHARTDRPPPYHILFVLLTASSSLLMIAICATEVEVLCCIIGLVFNLTESFIASSIRSFAAAVSDVILNMELALQGYERMAFAAVLAGPIFTITIGMGLPYLFNIHVEDHESAYWLFGEHGANSYFFFVLTICTTLMWTITFNFFARRSAAIFGFIMYFLFILYAVLAEFEFIHEISEDRYFEPV